MVETDLGQGLFIALGSDVIKLRRHLDTIYLSSNDIINICSYLRSVIIETLTASEEAKSEIEDIVRKFSVQRNGN